VVLHRYRDGSLCVSPASMGIAFNVYDVINGNKTKPG
jgi:hypothetical protein